MRFIKLILCCCLWIASVTAQAADISFSLNGPEGKTYKADDFPGKYLMIAVGFTSCPDICPTTLLEFREALKELGELSDYLQPIFITIDPLRDEPQRLNQYTHYFHEKILGLQGDLQQTADVARQLNATYGYLYDKKEVYPPDLPDGYTVYHSTFIYLFSPAPDLEMVDFFNYNQGGTFLANQLRPYLQELAKTQKAPQP